MMLMHMVWYIRDRERFLLPKSTACVSVYPNVVMPRPPRRLPTVSREAAAALLRVLLMWFGQAGWCCPPAFSTWKKVLVLLVRYPQLVGKERNGEER